MGAAVSTGVAVAGGLLGMSQKQAEAKRQRELLGKQEAAQRMQADLQLFSLMQQRGIDNMSDMVTDAAQKQAYLTTKSALAAQGVQQQLEMTRAEAEIQNQQQLSQANTSQKLMAAKDQQSQQRLQAGAQAVEQLANSSGEEQQLVSNVLKQLQNNTSGQNSIALLLDYAASAGGVNEAIQMLAGGTGREAVEAGANAARAQQKNQSNRELTRAAEKAGVNLADVTNALTNANTIIEQQSTNYGLANATNDARASYATNQAGLQAMSVANEGNYGIMNASNALQRQSRYLTSLANENALKQGQAINSEILALQQRNIQSPGFFDYVNLGVQGYGMYRGLK